MDTNPTPQAPAKKTFYKRWWFIAIVVVVVLMGMGSAFGDKKSADVAKPSSTQQSADKKAAENKEAPKAAEKKEPEVPAEYQNALESAKTYSDMMHMSKKGIYDQLTSDAGDKFPKEAAQYAVDNLKADYKQNAFKKAETYQKDMHMSKTAIRDQLISEYGEKFTAEEAEYAVKNLK